MPIPTINPPDSRRRSKRPSLQALRVAPTFGPQVAGLRALLAAADLDGHARQVGRSAQALPEVEDLKRNAKMTADNSKPCRPTGSDLEIGLKMRGMCK